MKAKTKRPDQSGAFDEQQDLVRVARGFAYGIGSGVALWLLVAALVVWLI